MQDKAKAASIVEFTTTTTKTGTTVKVKVADKIQALDRLARHLGIYLEDNQQKVAAAPAVLDERAARDLARRLKFMMRSTPGSVSGDVVEGEYLPAQVSNSDTQH
jgi:hypothetical protein